MLVLTLLGLTETNALFGCLFTFCPFCNIKWPLFSWLSLQQSATSSTVLHTSLTALITTIMYNNNTEQCNCTSNCNCQVGSCSCVKN
ncbi:uncharacterized protein EDB93DRAFT_1134474 [Suillus bovinus]|uniref:uncharacterized protein n=1 Tax=Suillus bovinus TaxID=48563 RepID=UPI001B87A467|nr:uncharacterized protein EDB93DRAFT_1134474 [Suillus bovinus]KAG2153736.1 hypothetical protein EDB93DRAFT_1134474 [Suillus bovinus]